MAALRWVYNFLKHRYLAQASFKLQTEACLKQDGKKLVDREHLVMVKMTGPTVWKSLIRTKIPDCQMSVLFRSTLPLNSDVIGSKEQDIIFIIISCILCVFLFARVYGMWKQISRKGSMINNFDYAILFHVSTH